MTVLSEDIQRPAKTAKSVLLEDMERRRCERRRKETQDALDAIEQIADPFRRLEAALKIKNVIAEHQTKEVVLSKTSRQLAEFIRAKLPQPVPPELTEVLESAVKRRVGWSARFLREVMRDQGRLDTIIAKAKNEALSDERNDLIQVAFAYRDAAQSVFDRPCQVTTRHPVLEGTILIVPISGEEAEDYIALAEKRERVFEIVERENHQYVGQVVITFESEPENVYAT